MNKGIIALIILFVLGLTFFLEQEYNMITSFAVSSTENARVTIDLFPLSREIPVGGDIRVSTRIDTDTFEEIDVILRYTITNNKGIVVFQKSKTLAVQRTAKVTDNLMIHRTLDPGPYLVDVEVMIGDRILGERDTFNVVAEPIKVTLGNFEAYLLLIVFIMLVMFLILLWIQNRRVNKILKHHEKHDIEEIME